MTYPSRTAEKWKQRRQRGKKEDFVVETVTDAPGRLSKVATGLGLCNGVGYNSSRVSFSRFPSSRKVSAISSMTLSSS